MTKKEFLNSQEFQELSERIRKYPRGYELPMPYWKMTARQRNALMTLMGEMVKENVLESISIELDLQGNWTVEIFRRK